MSVPNLPGLAKAKEPKSMPATKPAAKPEAGKKDPEGKGPCVCMCMCILFFHAMVQVLPRSPNLKRKGQAVARTLVHVNVFCVTV